MTKMGIELVVPGWFAMPPDERAGGNRVALSASVEVGAAAGASIGLVSSRTD
jgi:hypothetical protein